MELIHLLITIVLILTIIAFGIFCKSIVCKRSIKISHSDIQSEIVDREDIYQLKNETGSTTQQIVLCKEIKSKKEDPFIDLSLSDGKTLNYEEFTKIANGQEFIDFENTFLVKRANIPRRQSYMSQDIYQQVSRYLRVIADDITVTAYIDNVMRHHLEQYKDEINNLYEKNTHKPL